MPSKHQFPHDAQRQFLDVVDRDEAERRFHAALSLEPLGVETVPLSEALGRVLARDVQAAVDVPSFDRSNYDGYAVRAADTFGATEQQPCSLELLPETVAPGRAPHCEIRAGAAALIATGGMLPRGADGVVMVEHTDTRDGRLIVSKSITPSFGVSFAGTDMTAGETVAYAGQWLTSRETGVLAAVGVDRVDVWRRPRVAILSTGDEIIAPGTPPRAGAVYDSNGQILADAVRELGAQPLRMGIVPDDVEQLRQRVRRALEDADVVLLSGGTSKGGGDLCYTVVGEWTDPGIVAHGVALKPGKPICLAVTGGKPVVVLPGFPTSAIFTFHEFVAPVVRALAGVGQPRRSSVSANLAVKVNSEIGRTEYLLVGLAGAAESDPEDFDSSTRTAGTPPLAAYPMGKGSGSVTTFSRADGFVTIDRHTEIVPAGTAVEVQLLGDRLQLADLVAIGSHCAGLDYLLGLLRRRGMLTKSIAVGSRGGLAAAARGECDVAGIHLMDPATGEYNRPFLTDALTLIPGYTRRQGVVYRPGDGRFEGRAAAGAIRDVRQLPDCVMVNRNQGSGTRVLIDRLLGAHRPPGFAVAPSSHHAVAAAVAQGRADWGVAIQWVARHHQLGFLPLADEHYDFAVPRSRLRRPGVRAFTQLLAECDVQAHLQSMGFMVNGG